MSLSKRHYEAIARVIRVNMNYAYADHNARAAVADVARDLATAFYADSDRFDRQRFLAACDVPEFAAADGTEGR